MRKEIALYAASRKDDGVLQDGDISEERAMQIGYDFSDPKLRFEH
jgi:hypothetical protein